MSGLGLIGRIGVALGLVFGVVFGDFWESWLFDVSGVFLKNNLFTSFMLENTSILEIWLLPG